MAMVMFVMYCGLHVYFSLSKYMYFKYILLLIYLVPAVTWMIVIQDRLQGVAVMPMNTSIAFNMSELQLVTGFSQTSENRD